MLSRFRFDQFRHGCPGYFKGSSSNSSATTSTDVVNDSRVGVADEGVYAATGASVDKSANDNRVFDDHSSFGITATDSHANQSTNVDSRDFSDHSSFSSSTDVANSGNTTTNTSTTSTNTDSRDFSDHSSFTDSRQTSVSNSGNTTTNITTSDPGVLKEVAAGAFSSVNTLALQGGSMLDSVLAFGDKVSARAQAATDNAAAATAKAATDNVSFANTLATRALEHSESSDTQNTQKIITAVTVIATVLGAVAAAKEIFGNKKANK